MKKLSLLIAGGLIFSAMAYFFVFRGSISQVQTANDNQSQAVLSTDLENYTQYFVKQSSDDAEEGTDGQVDLANEDLDLGQLSGFESAKSIGIRFENVGIPEGEQIKSAFLQFTMEGNRTKDKPTELVIHAELATNAETFAEDPKNISSREVTQASVVWLPEAWDPKKNQEKRPRTPDLSLLIEEVMSLDGWQEGNALAFIITGTGERDALSFDGGGKENGPRLLIEFESVGFDN